ncbi:MAG: putative Adenylate/Guanylate Cyclase [Proteobacteria bacterium]|nr:putative Adenylate/Guanylate Cyclase [Pseudomonadota bacterium]
MASIEIAKSVRRPLTLKIFGIAVILQVLMICVTVVSSFSLGEVEQQVSNLSRYYIEIEQKTSEVHVHGLTERILLERMILDRPKLSFADAQKLATEERSKIASCGSDEMRKANAEIRKIHTARPDRYLARYELIRLCAAEKLGRVEQLVGEALALEESNNDVGKVKLLAGLLQEIKYIGAARLKQHAAFEQYIKELKSDKPASVDVVRDKFEENRLEVSRKVSGVTRMINEGTRTSIKSAFALVQRAQWFGWGITLTACVVGLLLAAYISRNLVRPVRDLLTGTTQVEKGNLDVRINVTTSDEIQQLGDHFNHMVGELRQKAAIKEMFGKYVDPQVVEGLLARNSVSDSGERRVMTVFFSDIEGFTSFSENMTPAALVRVLNQYLSSVTEPIRASQGIIDKYVGDAVMAFWGPPFVHEGNQAVLACNAALEQQARVALLQEKLPDILGFKIGIPVIHVRMGLTTGDATVGSIGPDDARSYTVIGDTVNLASRLEGANKVYKTRIIINDQTQSMAKDEIETRELDLLRVMGKQQAVRIYELLGRKGEMSENLVRLRDQFEMALGLYRQQKWEEAMAGFNYCLEIDADDGPSQVFVERIANFKVNPPGKDWDGTWSSSSK